ncbi:UDP-N-acetylmuramate dehydrogenase [Egicoccus halophilus]|uniref:UDP-N-acetylenolpyruvoylglucosamine reductase n=1 Tax=Egicoccus halophilus TaxID=1670830 RepID=A0A8J3ER72_9ACTN|nr:UDP-N-acetylmuramate dehydrogenase [Egicoccus halophilus]GGI04331.1 UDP-N-acetylenolpyruvoylglucosamine reductase 1 [Egicoccus halophilus]
MAEQRTDLTRSTATTTDALVAELRDGVVGEVRAQASLAELTTLRVGGAARVLVVAERDQDLAAVGAACRRHGVPWTVVGRGSNLLVADAGWPGVAIQLGRGFRSLEVTDGRVRAGAAEPLPALAMRVADAGLGGFAWACAVPGTLGGAVRMNAGAHGGQMADHLVEVDVVRLHSGTRETWPVEALGLTYRHSSLPDDAVVVDATLQLRAGEPEAVKAEIREIRGWRREHQPLNEPNCGSVFTNPPDDSAGRLVEAVGGKDLVVGGARISDRHANFIVTSPGASAADVRTLIRQVRTRVQARFGVRLRPEVAMLGDFDDGGLDP